MPHGYSGLTRTEAAVMDLWDADRGTRAIAAELGLTHFRVANIVGLYASDEKRDQDKAVRAGSAALLAALRLARPEIAA